MFYWKTDPVQELALPMAAETAGTEELSSLLKLAKAGDVRAFEQILIRHERWVFLTALRLLGRVEDAQDAAQEVFLRLHKHLRRFDESREFAPWLYRVTVNVCRDIAKRRTETEELKDAGQSADPDAALIEQERRRVVSEGLRRLPEKERAAIVLRDIEGLPTRQVARILGSSEATVRSQVSRARLKIRQFADRFQKRRI